MSLSSKYLFKMCLCQFFQNVGPCLCAKDRKNLRFLSNSYDWQTDQQKILITIRHQLAPNIFAFKVQILTQLCTKYADLKIQDHLSFPLKHSQVAFIKERLRHYQDQERKFDAMKFIFSSIQLHSRKDKKNPTKMNLEILPFFLGIRTLSN